MLQCIQLTDERFQKISFQFARDCSDQIETWITDPGHTDFYSLFFLYHTFLSDQAPRPHRQERVPAMGFANDASCQVEHINADIDYATPIICTPEELMEV